MSKEAENQSKDIIILFFLMISIIHMNILVFILHLVSQAKQQNFIDVN